MLYELVGAFKPDVESYEQQECIEIFFDSDDFWKKQFDFVVDDTGSDEETHYMINLVLSNFASELPDYIIAMLKDWIEFGF